MYLDYDTFIDMGGNVPYTAFLRFSHMAESIVDRLTQNRIKAMETVPDTVKYCLVDIINAMGAEDPAKLAHSAPVQSFSNDGYSETYSEPLSGRTQEAAFYGLIRTWLGTTTDDRGTPLLYLGVDR